MKTDTHPCVICGKPITSHAKACRGECTRQRVNAYWREHNARRWKRRKYRANQRGRQLATYHTHMAEDPAYAQRRRDYSRELMRRRRAIARAGANNPAQGKRAAKSATGE